MFRVPPFCAWRLATLAIAAAVLTGCEDTTAADSLEPVQGQGVAQRQGQSQGNVQSQLEAAQRLVNQGKFAEAEEMLATIVENNPQVPFGWYLLGYSLHAQGELDSALECHLKAAELGQGNIKAVALYNAACVYSLKKESDKAFEKLQESIAAGMADRVLLKTDTDLDNIRSDERFAGLLPPILEGDELFKESTRVLQTFVGERANSEFGWVARRMGDVDNDGVIDFVTTAPSFGNNTGKVYVYSSRDGKLLFSRLGQPGQRLGNGASGAGDVNGDGVPDAIVGGPNGGPGIAEVLSGKDGTVIHTFSGQKAAGQFGYKVGALGDINDDGCDDVVVTELAGDGDASGCGLCYGYSGKDGSLMFTLSGEAAGDKYGSAVAGNEDPDHPMLVVGAQNAGAAQRGRVYVYKFDGGEPELAFTIIAEETGKNLGQMFLSFPGDLNADGVPDVYCSDFNDVSGAPGGGRIFVVSGADGSNILDIKGTQPGEGLGTSPSDAGDVNGDGIGDLIVGAWQNREGAQSGGKVYLYSGADGGELAAWTCLQQGDTFGFDAVGIGDVDGDGHVDFLLTSAWSPARGPKTGRVFIIAGRDYSENE